MVVPDAVIKEGPLPAPMYTLSKVFNRAKLICTASSFSSSSVSNWLAMIKSSQTLMIMLDSTRVMA